MPWIHQYSNVKHGIKRDIKCSVSQLDIIERVTSLSRWVKPLVSVEKKPELDRPQGDMDLCGHETSQ